MNSRFQYVVILLRFSVYYKLWLIHLHLQINFWKEIGEDETMSIYNIISGQTDTGLVIGLEPHTYYYVNVQVYNSAGNGPKSQDYLEETLRAGRSMFYLSQTTSLWISLLGM